MNDSVLPDRFWSKILVNEETGCWEWSAARSYDGYAHFSLAGTTVRAHRVAYEALVDSIDEDMHLDHLCRVRHCVNPAHLEMVTHPVNVGRGERAAKTQCIQGHPFEGANLYVGPDGRRKCRMCVNAKQRRYYARQRS